MEKSPGEKRLRVLIVEDSQDDADLAVLTLRKSGFTIKASRVDTEPDMRNALQDGQWDLVLTDSNMPRFSAESALAVFHQARNKDIPFIILSGGIGEETAAKLIRDGADEYVPKDKLGVLGAAVEHAMQSVGHRLARQLAEDELALLAHYDKLTELPNRFGFTQRLQEMLPGFSRDGAGAMILSVGIQDLDNIIQTLGYEIGDEILRESARRLQSCLPAGVIARGDGFRFLICNRRDPDVPLAEVIGHIHAAFQEELEVFDSYIIPMDIRIGATAYPDDDADSDLLVRHAEAALSHNRINKSALFHLYTEEMAKGILRRLAIGSDLRQALSKDEIQVHYQPLVDLYSGRVIGAEALVRLWNENGELILPEYISLAEETGLVIGLGAKVLEIATCEFKNFQDIYPQLEHIAVNVSAKQIQDDDFIGIVANALGESGLQPASLKLELTESDLMENLASAINIMERLQKMGIRIAVDDFGTGLSSLSYIQQFPVDTLKIDKSFVLNMTVDRNHASIVQAIIAMAKALGLQTVAEGVETEEHRIFLKAYGVDVIQGFLISKPVPGKQFSEFLKRYASGDTSTEDAPPG